MGSDVRSKPTPPTVVREGKSPERDTATSPGWQPERPASDWAAPWVLEQAIGSPQSASPEGIVALQRLAGNVAVSGRIQARLMVGPANDYYEREADRVADQVLAMPAPSGQGVVGAGAGPVQRQAEEEEELQAKPLAASITPLVQRQGEEEEELQAEPLTQLQGEEEEEEVQAKSLAQRQEDEEELQTRRIGRDPAGGFGVGSSVESRVAASRGAGAPLSDEVRAYMEPRFGVSFAGVRIHTGGEAARLSRELRAQAFTHGQDVYLGAGRYNPETDAGKHLLAHELAHVVQQTGAREVRHPARGDNAGVSSNARAKVPALSTLPARALQFSRFGRWWAGLFYRGIRRREGEVPGCTIWYKRGGDTNNIIISSHGTDETEEPLQVNAPRDIVWYAVEGTTTDRTLGDVASGHMANDTQQGQGIRNYVMTKFQGRHGDHSEEYADVCQFLQDHGDQFGAVLTINSGQTLNYDVLGRTLRGFTTIHALHCRGALDEVRRRLGVKVMLPV